MNQYLLSVYDVEGEMAGPSTPEEMQTFMGRVIALEEEMDRAGDVAGRQAFGCDRLVHTDDPHPVATGQGGRRLPRAPEDPRS